MRKFITLAFWDYTCERALKTAMQTLLAGDFIGGALFDLDSAAIFSIAAGSALASVATSIITYKS